MVIRLHTVLPEAARAQRKEQGQEVVFARVGALRVRRLAPVVQQRLQ
eukprot:gene4376-5579_t